MSSKWKIVKLQDVCEKITDGSHFSPRSVDSGYLMASVKDMTYQNFDLSGCRKIAEEDYQKLVANGCKPEVNDVLIAKDGNTLLKYVFVNKENRDFVLLSSIAILRPNLKVLNPYFLRYYLTDSNTKKLLLQGYSSGSAIPRVVLKDFKQLPLPLPSMKEQEAIADRLSILDDKIELNHSINKNLEEMAQALFKRWFVDFEFPNENGEPYKSSGGEFEESELGLIPKGWRASLLSELVHVKYGKDHKKLNDGSIPVYGSGGVMRYVDTALYSGESVLIPRKGSLNNVMYINEPFWSVDTMFYTVMNMPNIAKFIYFFICSKDMVSMNVGSAVPSMTTDILNKMPVVISPSYVFEEFDKIASALFEKVHNLTKENKKLSDIRDSLLPKLMSGEIRVPLKQEYSYSQMFELPMAAENKVQYSTT